MATLLFFRILCAYGAGQDGSEAFSAIWYRTTSKETGAVFLSGFSPDKGCGTFSWENGALVTLLAGPAFECGGGGGEVSPDGRRLLGYAAGDLAVIDLDTRAIQTIRGVKGLMREDVTWKKRVRWSPDGRWIVAAPENGKIVRIDSGYLSKHRVFGGSQGPPVWLPDSRRIVYTKPQLKCWLSPYFESLEVLDLESGRRHIVRGSSCKIGGFNAWFDPATIQ